MKKIAFLWLVLASFCFAGCSWFARPANVEVIGVATVQNDHGMLFVQIDSAKYAPFFVYTNAPASYGRTQMPPVEGMPVTAFTIHGEPQVNFIAGNLSQEYLEEYFYENNTPHIFALVLFMTAMLIFCFLAVVAARNQKKQPQKKKG